MKPYKFTIIHKWEPKDFPKLKKIGETFQAETNDGTVAQQLLLNDEATFHNGGKP
jgi:hypothetical protein